MLNIIGLNFGMETQNVTELTTEHVSKVCLSVIETMKNGLPREAHSIEVFDYILEASKETLHSMPVKLQ